MVQHRRLLGPVLALMLALSTSAPADEPKKEALPAPKPPELRILERLVGTWDTEMVSKPAEWTPKEVRSRGINTCEWILDGRFLQTRGKATDVKGEALQLMTYNPARKEYYMWFFDSLGMVSIASGQWDSEKETLTWKAEVDENIFSTNRVHFVDRDTIIWTLTATDKNKKVYLNMSGKMVRRKEK